MFFVLAKIVGFIIKPLHILFLLMASTAALRHLKSRVKRKRQGFVRALHRFSFILLSLWIANLIIPIIPYMAVHVLEERFPHPDIEKLNPDIIVILGGWQGSPSNLRNPYIPPISSSGDRLMAGLILSKKFPDALVAMPGGLKPNALLEDNAFSEADISQAVLDGLDLDPSRFIIEGLSRNTAENAALLKTLLESRGTGIDGQMVLITSAWHMPRAMGSFRAAGLSPIPYTADYITRTKGLPIFSLIGRGMNLTSVALQEYIGLLAYRITGRSDAFLPKP